MIGSIPSLGVGLCLALRRNENVALVLDGVAGMFQATTHRQEVAYLLKRKGVASGSFVPLPERIKYQIYQA